ncbi:MAG: hypothetical protein LBE80_01635, partial [Deltaproteobacteria bacterium]|nr:hypothetical protein [Deltaproteobacteria bacterium]
RQQGFKQSPGRSEAKRIVTMAIGDDWRHYTPKIKIMTVWSRSMATSRAPLQGLLTLIRPKGLKNYQGPGPG